jgi:hypothetical protein
VNVNVFLFSKDVESKSLGRVFLPVPPTVGDKIELLGDSTFVVRSRSFQVGWDNTSLSIYVQPIAEYSRELAQVKTDEA